MSKTAWIIVAVVVLVIGIIVVAVIFKPNKNASTLDALGTSYLSNEELFRDQNVSTPLDAVGGLVGSIFGKKN